MASFRMEVTGMRELFEKMEKLGEEGRRAASCALYEGAGVVADAVSKGMIGISTEPFKYAKGGRKRKPSPEEKAAVAEGPHGVARFRKKLNVVETTVGFNGNEYANVDFSHMSRSARTNYKEYAFKKHSSNASSFLKKFGKGKGAQNQKPVGVIANSINSGTSFMEKQPFMRKAFSTSKNAATARIEGELQARLNKINVD